MHIKQVIIRGFKTYKDQVQVPQDFDQGVNVIVGYNGSGKSNFFNAILFVISDRFGTLRNEMRKSLLHEGAGPAVLTAFVEIVFDNTDKRMPVDRDEVRIRRTIAAKKDDYTLDGKSATRNEVFKLLESCGFAKSNPYYIVQQGRVSELTLMTDANRLDLLKEISGASTYDERRQECSRILEDLRVKREKTDGVVEVVRRRITSLEDEQKELRQYQKLEQSRRCLEFVMTDRDWRTTQERIDNLEVQKVDAGVKVQQVQRDLNVAQERAAEADAEVFQVSARKAQVEAKHQECERLRGLRVEELTRARLELDDEKSRAQAMAKALEETKTEKKKIEKQMEDIESEIAEGRPELEQKQARLRDNVHRKHVAQVERDALLAKQGRGAHYSNVQQRNKYLDDEIKRRTPKQEAQRKALEDSEKGIKDLEKKQEKSAKAITDKQANIRSAEAALGPDLANQLDIANSELDRAAELRRALLQERENLSRAKDDWSAKIQRLQSRVEGTMPRPVRSALTDAVSQVRKMGHGEKILGTLLDNITVDPQFAVAVESAAGNALFNLLVDTDDIAAEIVKYVRQQQLGSITCTPLNQLRPKKRDYPTIKGCQPLVELIQCSDAVRPAVLQVFGRTMVCNSIENCDLVSHKHGLDAVTMEGDRVSGQGTMTGGYQDPSRYVRLKLTAERREAQLQLENAEAGLGGIEKQMKDSSKLLEKLHQQKRDTQAMRQTRRAELAQATEALHDAERELRRLQEATVRQKEHEHEVRTCLAEYTAGLEALVRERQSKTLGQLTDEEHAHIERLANELRSLNTNFQAEEEECNKIQRELRGKEQHLNGYLRRRHHEVEAELMRAQQQDHLEQAHDRERAVDRLTKQVQEIEGDMKRLRADTRVQEENLKQSKQKLEEIQKDSSNKQALLSGQVASIDEVALKISNLTKKKGEYDEKLRKLTIVAADLHTYKKMPTPQLVDELRNVSKELTKFEHVNKKAIDQFEKFQDQLRDLDEEGLEITKSQEAIENFIKEVDAKKEHLIADVLVQVDKHFQEVFRELVRDGSAKLSVVKEVDEDIETMRAAKKKKTTFGAPELSSGIKGVKIEVSFSAQSGGTVRSFLTMSQLSGGQKTVVALALIFAMQRLEPAPFYLFDEVDAALDTQYRTAVAQLLKKDATNGVQIVVTTFRPEIIDISNRCYRVSMRNRVSMIDSVERNEAREVVEMQAAQEGLGE